ncbi:MAG: protein kinase [Planctomycetes bacterium]|nr:protein kinase [Planctomycetota bacterium]
MSDKPTSEDILLGRIALSSGLITRERLDECIHILEQTAGPATLGDIFVERGYITENQLNNLRGLAGRDDPARTTPPAPAGMTESAFFGKLAIQEGLVSAEQVFECLESQVDLEKGGKSRQLGEIMVEKGYLKLGDVSRLLKLQKKVVMRCPNCGASYTVSDELARRPLSCQKCRAPLEVAQRLVVAGSEQLLTPGGVSDTILGKIFSGCQVEARIGRGGMATVYKGRHLGLNKSMAVKILSVSVKDPDSIDRFVKEARACARLEHPNIIQVYNVGQKFGFTFILMQYIEGHTLAEILEHKGRISSGQSIKIVREVARALGFAHHAGIVHRDVKPDNIFITKDGEVKVGDFGLAIEMGSFRKTDTISGTPFYMPPETWKGDAPDGRSDIYSLGVTFYTMVTGRKPYEGEGPIMLMEQHLHDKPKPPTSHNPDLPKGVSAVIMKMIAKHPKDRYQTADALLADLERVEGGREPEADYDEQDLQSCRFCGNRNSPMAKRCSACGENLGGAYDVLLMDNEFQCPKCRAAVEVGARMCTACGLVFCKKCHTAPAVKGTDWCVEHQPPPPQVGQVPHRPVRRR